jgi:hypothetical protein
MLSNAIIARVVRQTHALAFTRSRSMTAAGKPAMVGCAAHRQARLCVVVFRADRRATLGNSSVVPR